MDDKKEGMNNTAPQVVVHTAKGAKELAGNTLSGAVSGLTRKQPTRKRQEIKISIWSDEERVVKEEDVNERDSKERVAKEKERQHGSEKDRDQKASEQSC